MDIDIDIKLDAGHRQSRLKKNKNLLVGNPICSNVVTKNIKEKKSSHFHKENVNLCQYSPKKV
jgi:hypothetical protein